MSYDSIGDVSSSLMSTGDIAKVTSGVPEFVLEMVYVYAKRIESVVVYRSGKDIGKDEHKMATQKGEAIVEYIGNVEKIQKTDLARDLKYNDMDDISIKALNTKIGRPVRTFMIGLKRDENYIATKDEDLIEDFKQLAFIGVFGEIGSILSPAISPSVLTGILYFKYRNMEMTKCFLQMVDRFLKGTGETWLHEDDILYEEVKKHHITQ